MWGGKVAESKSDSSTGDSVHRSTDYKDSGDCKHDFPKIEIKAIEIVGDNTEITAPLELKIKFDIDRDALASYWIVKLLVDSCERRLIQILGETPVDDYTEGDNEMYFSVDTIDVSHIPHSTLANYGLLMACLIIDGEEISNVNMVVNVTISDGKIMREIMSPLE